MRRAVAQQALDRLVVQAAVLAEAARLHVAVPDASLREAVFSIPAFQDAGGHFDRARLQQFLARAGMTEPRFLGLMREDVAQRELVGTLAAGAPAAGSMVSRLFAFQGQTRTATRVELPFSAVPEPPAPDAATLHRWYDDNPDRFRTPEERRVKMVILSVDTVARGIEVPEDKLHAAYDARSAEFHVPEKRSVEVATLPDQARAAAVAQQWRLGADWDAVQKAATDAGGSGVVLADALPGEMPAPELARAVFAAPPGTVTGPVQEPFGWAVLVVTGVTAAVDRPFEAVRAELATRLAREQAQAALPGKVQALQDALAGGTTLDELPGDLGAAAVEGTLDAQGNTPDGEPAPIPGPPGLRQAIVAQAFNTAAGQPPSVSNGPDGAVFSLQVLAVTPPAARPYDDVAAAVLADWRRARVRHVQDAAAAGLLAAVQDGKPLVQAAAAAGLHTSAVPAVGRGQPPAGVPSELARALLGLKPGEATMVETPDGFTVAVLDAVRDPDPKTDALGVTQLREALSRSMGEDAAATYAAALRDRDRPRINAAAVDAVLGQGGG